MVIKLPIGDFDCEIGIIRTRRYGPYAGLLLAPAEGFSLWPGACFALWAKKGLICCFGPFLAIFLCPVVTLVTFSSNLSNFEKNPNKPKKIQKNPKKIKNFKIAINLKK